MSLADSWCPSPWYLVGSLPPIWHRRGFDQHAFAPRFSEKLRAKERSRPNSGHHGGGGATRERRYPARKPRMDRSGFGVLGLLRRRFDQGESGSHVGISPRA